MGLARLMLALELASLGGFWLIGAVFEFLREQDYKTGRRERRQTPRG